MASNAHMHYARGLRNDEFFTLLPDVENELRWYKDYLRGKIVFCNCDDPTSSAFWEYFHLQFNQIGLKKLVATHYDKEKPTYKLEYHGENDNDISVGQLTPLAQNGDFRSPECLELLHESDVVVTNPPFSLFREYITTLVEYHKKFVILGHPNAATNDKNIFPLFFRNEVWVGMKPIGKEMYFRVDAEHEQQLRQTKKEGSGWKIIDGNFRARANVMWYTNIDIPRRHERLDLWKHYSPDKYPKFDNYDAINVGKVEDIPGDYLEPMGVPVTFIGRINPEIFEIIGVLVDKNCSEPGFIRGVPTYIDDEHKKYVGPVLNGKALYPRLIIRKK